MSQTFKVFAVVFLIFMITACENSFKVIPAEMEIPENPISECPDSPNCIRTTQVFEEDSISVFNAFKNSISKENPFELETKRDEENLSISAVYKIPVFGWLDDAELIFESDKENKNLTFVHLKSSSREGYYDLGVNKRRINRILKKARKELNL
ncbi:MAG: DUF1499 domain-containing protein [Balneola sp.]